MAVCSKGHQSTADDYCDVCGTPMAGADVTSVASGSAAKASPAAAKATCVACGTPLEARFCERCGHDSLAPAPAASTVDPPAPTPAAPAQPAPPAPAQSTPFAPPAPAQSTPFAPPAPADAATRSWQVVVTADRDYFERMQALQGPDVDEVSFPQFFPERRFPLLGKQLLIGRRSRSRGVYPDIDLAGPPEDSAVSHTHALLIPQPGETWAVVDLRSTNCTYLNGATDPIEAETPLPLRDGDHINVGAWTRLTLRAT
jgi:hypothetical protein